MVSPYIIIDRILATTPPDEWGLPPMVPQGPDYRAERVGLRVFWALEAAGMLVDVGDGMPCEFCEVNFGTPHDADCPTPRCVITGHQRLVCNRRKQPNHDCGVSLWSEDWEDPNNES